jgi:hypothetical protein
MRLILVGERHAECAALARVEGVHVAFHIVRRKPQSHGVRVKKSMIDSLAPALTIRETWVLALWEDRSAMLAHVLYEFEPSVFCIT